MKKGYKHIVFDLDGTLIDSRAVFLDGLKETLIHFGFPIDERLEKSFGLSQKGIDELYQIPESIKKDFLTYWYVRLMKPMEFKESADTLRRLKEGGYTIGIVSARESLHIVESIKLESFSKYVDIPFGSEKALYNKPHPSPLIGYAKEYGLDLSEILYIGDLDTDMQCAKWACVDFAYAGWGWENKVESDVLTFYSFQELLDYLL